MATYTDKTYVLYMCFYQYILFCLICHLCIFNDLIWILLIQIGILFVSLKIYDNIYNYNVTNMLPYVMPYFCVLYFTQFVQY